MAQNVRMTWVPQLKKHHVQGQFLVLSRGNWDFASWEIWEINPDSRNWAYGVLQEYVQTQLAAYSYNHGSNKSLFQRKWNGIESRGIGISSNDLECCDRKRQAARGSRTCSFTQTSCDGSAILPCDRILPETRKTNIMNQPLVLHFGLTNQSEFNHTWYMYVSIHGYV